jgi:hypothetical protein
LCVNVPPASSNFLFDWAMPKYSCIGKRRPLSPLALCFINDMPSRSRGAMRPSFDRVRPRKREGAGNAGCTLHPRSRAQRRVGCAHEHTGSAEASGIPCVMALRLMPRSPRRRIRLVTVVGGFCDCSTRSGQSSHRRLGTSNGCQDHTVLPYATTRLRQEASPGIASFVLRACQSLTRFNPPCDRISAPTLSRPPHPIPRS